MKQLWSFFWLFLSPLTVALAQLTIVVPSIPDNSPPDPTIYIVGNFNNWDAGNPDYILTNNGDGTYQITLNINAGLVEYKFTRGSWATVEGNANGGFIPNHEYNYDGTPTTISTPILSWEDIGGTNSTAAPNVTIMDDDFYMPEFDRYRRIWLYLPPDYFTSNKYYPVLYMHDGQNLFDIATSFSGEWEVDETLNSLFDQGDYGVIVVGIDNGGAERINEYTPWPNPGYGGGDGDTYVQFLINTLKPHIDANYRTLPEQQYTGIMGSSLGGLISSYAAVEYQEVFGKAGIFSPSYWFSDEVYPHVSDTGKEQDMKYYLMGGQNEGGSMAQKLNQMESTMLNAGFDNNEVNKIIHADGQHAEWYWRREFGDAYEWLFGNLSVANAYDPKLGPFRIFPNPASEGIQVDYPENIEKAIIEIFSTEGKRIIRRKVGENEVLPLPKVEAGMYILYVKDRKEIIHTQQIMLF